MVNINTLNGGNITVTLGSSGNTYPRWVDPIYSDELIPNYTEFGDIYSIDGLIIANGRVYDPGTNAYSDEEISSFDEVTVLNMLIEQDGVVVQSFTLYRRYVPGHWEDENGNWVNGYWSNTNENGIWTGQQGSTAKLYETNEELEADGFSQYDIEAMGITPPVWLSNNTILDFTGEGKGLNVARLSTTGELFLREWTNTVQPPQ